jgi:hypothetical protein
MPHWKTVVAFRLSDSISICPSHRPIAEQEQVQVQEQAQEQAQEQVQEPVQVQVQAREETSFHLSFVIICHVSFFI